MRYKVLYENDLGEWKELFIIGDKKTIYTKDKLRAELTAKLGLDFGYKTKVVDVKK